VDTEAINAGANADVLPLALVAPSAIVARDLQIQIKIGNAIREHRLRDHRDLEVARQEKQEWVLRCTDLLNRYFNHSGATERFNNWVATILPEYAEFGMFVEAFGEEMKHRLNQLRVIVKSLRNMPEPLMPDTPADTTKGTAMVTETTPVAAPSSTNPEVAAPVIAQAMQAAQAQAALRNMAAAAVASEAKRATTSGQPAASRAAASSNKCGMLIVRTSDDDAACEAVRQFVEQLGLSLHVSQRARNQGADQTTMISNVGAINIPASNAASSSTPLLDELAAMQSSSASFALLFTATPEQPQLSGDPDALFDLGCCVGKLGAERVIVLHRGGDAHTDRFGLTHVVFDNCQGWQLQLAKHLKRGGVEVDLNKLI
jgi:hypothetical protein